MAAEALRSFEFRVPGFPEPYATFFLPMATNGYQYLPVVTVSGNGKPADLERQNHWWQNHKGSDPKKIENYG